MRTPIAGRWLVWVLLWSLSEVLMGQTDTLLAELRWQHRVLLVQANGVAAEVPRDRLQNARARLAERDLLVFLLPDPVSHDGAVRLADAETLAQRFDLGGATMRTVLLGKDGGVKLRQTGELDLEEVFVTIDAMPMRQREMRQRP